MLIAFSSRQTNLSSDNNILIKLANERLTIKQKQILTYILIEKPQSTITNVVHALARQLDCSYSALWLSIGQLKRIGLVEYGSQSDKKRQVILTNSGNTIAQNLHMHKRSEIGIKTNIPE